MTGGFLDGNIFRGLAFKILLFLTLALLPFGLISVFQTREIAQQIKFNAELSLLALTNQAVNGERLVLQEAFGAARGLNAAGQSYLVKSDGCQIVLDLLSADTVSYDFVGLVGANGATRCATDGRDIDVSSYPGIADRSEPPQRMITAFSKDVSDAEDRVLIGHPIENDGAFGGYLVLGVPLGANVPAAFVPVPGDAVDVVTFNSAGAVVRATKQSPELGMVLPENFNLTAMVGEQPRVFRSTSRGGDTLVYAVVPILPEVAYSMSIWRPEDLGAGLRQDLGYNLLLPVLMWMASLIVAFWSLNRLAVRHIRKLGRQMRLFAFDRRVPRSVLGSGVPRELVDMQAAFVRMAESIVRDEAALEDSLRDKNILLKEVHHRVKNNLQMISSIMNMQIRRAESEDARNVLKRLQDRILSLATVHKNLYQTNELDRVQAGKLIDEIVGQLLRVGLPAGRGVKVHQNYADIEMDADDAAPLTLLVSEAVTNALKYIDAPQDGSKPQLLIDFEALGNSEAVFRIANSTSAAKGSESTGLGTQLIAAFARQLSGHVEVDFRDNMHILEIRFPIQQRSADRYDF